MQVLVIPSFVIAIIFANNALVLGENCDKHGVLLYEDMACEPKYEGKKCPSRFDCNLKSSNNQECIVQNKSYAVNDRIEKNSVGLSCEFGCFCSRRRDGPYVSCAQGSCVTWGMSPPTGCYWTFDLKQCCSTGENCEPEEKVHKCLVDGTERREGERFAPKDSCHVCLCQKGFVDGEYKAPFCKRRACDAQIRNQEDVSKGCAPIYVPDESKSEGVLCCPSQWTCPDGTETFRKEDQNIPSDSGKTCKYGEKSLKIGDSFTKQVTYRYKPLNVLCECKIPPLLTCVGNK